MNTGRIITFYSYKGGVGRSFALANVAAILARWGCKVLCVDWDLEAPGLHHFFPERSVDRGPRGLVDIIESNSGKARLDWRDCVHTADVGATGKTVDIILAGRETDRYAERIHALDWKKLYEKHDLGEFLDRLRGEWKREYDFVLLDSRTGLTDISGICTVHLPDFVVQVFTANRQSIDGTRHMFEQVTKERSSFYFSPGKALMLPLLSRWEEKDAPDDAREWLPRILELVLPSFDEWRSPHASAQRLLELLKVPYKAKWNFGERLAVLEESALNPGSVAYHLHIVAALLARDFEDSDELCNSPEQYVRGAERDARDRRKADPLPEDASTASEVAMAPNTEGRSEGPFVKAIDLYRRKLALALARQASAEELAEIRREIAALERTPEEALLAEVQRTKRDEPAGAAKTMSKRAPRRTHK